MINHAKGTSSGFLSDGLQAFTIIEFAKYSRNKEPSGFSMKTIFIFVLILFAIDKMLGMMKNNVKMKHSFDEQKKKD